ncbi:Transcriptional regulator, IclR family [plant metagenome]|uniref:Transcriptional regulator, IclR family n=1 Tax=plant metagenome TaxID=1297885 RepID=A0A484VBE7_9ZZZZ
MLEKSAVPAIDRADVILKLLAASHVPVRTTELAQQCGLAKSTLYLLLDSLEQRRWIEKSGGGYIIGVGLYVLGAAYVRHDGLQNAFRIAAADYVSEHNEVIQLATLQGSEVVYLAREDARRPVRLVSDIGTRLPAHACALGKILLAQLSDDEVRRVLPDTLVSITERTLTKPAELLRDLADVRKSGLGRDLEEVAAGLNCFAVYVGETSMGRPIAVSSSIPIDRIDKRREKAIVQSLVKVAAQIAARVGARR